MSDPTFSEWQVTPGVPGIVDPATGITLASDGTVSAAQVRAAHEAAALAPKDDPAPKGGKARRNQDTDAVVDAPAPQDTEV